MPFTDLTVRIEGRGLAMWTNDRDGCSRAVATDQSFPPGEGIKPWSGDCENDMTARAELRVKSAEMMEWVPVVASTLLGI